MKRGATQGRVFLRVNIPSNATGTAEIPLAPRREAAHNEGVEKCMHPSYFILDDDFIQERNPKFHAASLGKLGQAILKHLQEYPDALSPQAIPSQTTDCAPSEDL